MTAQSQQAERVDNPADFFRSAVLAYLKVNMHTMLPGRIKSFDPDTQRAEVNLVLSQELQDGTKKDRSPLLDVPVQFFRWGGFSFTMPVKAGDECAVFFSERSMDNYLANGKAQEVPRDARYFDLSDAYAIPGLTVDSNKVPNFNNDNLEIKADDGSIIFEMQQGGKIAIKNASGELVQQLVDLLAILEAETVTIGGGSSQGTYPLDGNLSGVYTAIKIILETFKI